VGQKKDALVKMLEGKSHVHISIYIETGAETEPGCRSKVTVTTMGDLLMINGSIPIPIDDRYVVCLEDNFAEIVFMDPDNQIVHVEIWL
jgi:hypothetical protein